MRGMRCGDCYESTAMPHEMRGVRRRVKGLFALAVSASKFAAGSSDTKPNSLNRANILRSDRDRPSRQTLQAATMSNSRRATAACSLAA
jgi:hypothetical protein